MWDPSRCCVSSVHRRKEVAVMENPGQSTVSVAMKQGMQTTVCYHPSQSTLLPPPSSPSYTPSKPKGHRSIQNKYWSISRRGTLAPVEAVADGFPGGEGGWRAHGSGPARPSDGALRDLLTAGVSKVSCSKHIFWTAPRSQEDLLLWLVYTAKHIRPSRIVKGSRVYPLQNICFRNARNGCHRVCGRSVWFGASCVRRDPFTSTHENTWRQGTFLGHFKPTVFKRSEWAVIYALVVCC